MIVRHSVLLVLSVSLLAACGSQAQAPAAPPTAPLETTPAATAIQKIVPTPQTSITATTRSGTLARLGFTIRGWT
jgi:hypothetical protein